MKTPAFWYRPPGFLSTLLAPLSLVYAAGRALDSARRIALPFAQPVICVGNAVAGGAGKTPVTIALAQLLQDARPQIVTRGYGGSEAGPRRVKEGDTAESVGDEALLLADAAPTWVARNRRLGIGCALSASAPIVLLDDGLQNNTFRARLNLLVVDGASGFGNGQLLPAGPLREYPSLLARRLNGIVMIGADAHKIAAQFPGLPVFGATIESDLSALDRAQRYAAFAGLARPQKFFETCAAAGLNVVAQKSFADHQPYDAPAQAALLDWARSQDAQLLTTAKDAMRWPRNARAQLAVLPIRCVFDDPAAVRAFIRDRLDV